MSRARRPVGGPMTPAPAPDPGPGLLALLRRLWPYLRPHRPALAGALSALLAGVGLRLLEPWPLKVLFDRVLAATPRPLGQPWLDGLAPLQLALLCALAVLVVTSLRALAGYLSTVALATVGNRVTSQLRRDLFSHLQRLSLAFHGRSRGGDLTLRVTTDVGLLRDVAVTAALPLGTSALTLAGMALVMALLNPLLAALTFMTWPLFWLYSQRQGHKIKAASREQRRREGALAATAAEALSAIKTVQALSLERVFDGVFAEQAGQEQRQGGRAVRLSAGLERGVDVTGGVATALVLGVGAWLALDGRMTPGDLLVFLNYLRSAFNPLRDFAKYVGRLAKASAASERVLGLLDTAPEVHDRPDAVPAPTLRGAVRFESVTFGYDGRPLAIRNLTLEVPAGERVALVGPSGTGKSTLMSLLLRLYDPQAGRVLVDGRDVRGYTTGSLRAQIAVVMQDSLLFAASVSENIAYGAADPAAATAHAIEAAARTANAHDFIRALPEGYASRLSERGSSLSGGQRQRLAIARAAVRDAPILVLDEPTASLDDGNARAVMDALERLAFGRTTFLVTHDVKAASRCDRVLYLEHGQIVEDGTPAHLLRLGGRYAALYRAAQATPEARRLEEVADAL